jgi:DNA-directed RNA polymerase specialized sigma24 family protein
MTAKQQTVFVLLEVEGCSGREIATPEAIPMKTVRNRLARARAELTMLETPVEPQER